MLPQQSQFMPCAVGARSLRFGPHDAPVQIRRFEPESNLDYSLCKCSNSKTTEGFVMGASAAETVTWWASVYSPEKGRRLAKTTSDGKTSEITWYAESQYNDYKPITSPDGSMIAFFRVTNEADKETGDVSLWRSKICVMNADGTNVRELTGDDDFNGNLHWTRDGTNRITWWRITNYSGKPGDYSKVKIWRTSPDSKPAGAARNIS